MKTMTRYLLIPLSVVVPVAVGSTAAQVAGDSRQPLRFEQTVSPIYPPKQLDLGIFRGHARIAISVDHTGELKDMLAVAYSHRDFAKAALAVIPEWIFEPMQVKGEPVPTQADLYFNFEARGGVVSINASSGVNARLGGQWRTRGYAPCTLDELDRIPTPLTTVAPRYPEDLADRGVSGDAVVEFYIDESGDVRLPAVTHADFDELGFLAIEAVRQWSFEPPTRKGKPMITRVRQTMRFQPEQG